MATWFITGCSTGPGRALATAALLGTGIDAWRPISVSTSFPEGS